MYPSLNTTRLMAAEGDSFSLVLHAGDLAYSRGYATQWDNFMLQVRGGLVVGEGGGLGRIATRTGAW